MNKGIGRLILGVLGAIVLTALGWVIALSSAHSESRERIRGNEVAIEAVTSRLDRMDVKLNKKLDRILDRLP